MIYRLFITFWFLRELKTAFFWLYLWQLKEYHVGRFLDHFRTSKGRSLLLNPLLFLKLFLLSFFLLFKIDSFYLFLILLFLYLLESGKFLRDLFLKKCKKPVLTVKTLFLTLISFLVIIISFLVIFFQNLVIEKLLFFDLMSPFIFSIIVLFFQPLTVLWRNFIIEKAKEKRKKFKDLLVIGITGSYGKTSTKEFLYKILSEKYNVLKTDKHQNAEIGIAQCILNDLKKEHEIFIVEMGAYNKGGIKLLCDIAKPEIGILTGLNKQHLATFGSFQNIIKTKMELIQSLPESGTAIFNGSNKTIWDLKSKIGKYNNNLKEEVFCSVNQEKADYFADSIKEKKKSLSYNLIYNQDNFKINLNLIGKQNVENSLLAIACAHQLGVDLEKIKNICENIDSLFGELKFQKGLNKVDLLTSTYSANTTGVLTHLNHLKKWETKRIIIMPCLIELGGSTSQEHKKIGQKIGEVCDLAIITSKDQFSKIREGAVEKGMKKENIVFLSKPSKILKKLQKYLKRENIVLLEGRISDKLKRLLIQR